MESLSTQWSLGPSNGAGLPAVQKIQKVQKLPQKVQKYTKMEKNSTKSTKKYLKISGIMVFIGYFS